ncbi:MAG: glycosyltransferase [Acidimicrobiales bacterium]
MSEAVPIVRVITRLNVGGPARHALLLTRRLADEFPTTLVTGRSDLNEGELCDPAVVPIYVPLRRSVRPWADAAAMISVRRIFSEVRPTIIHTHMAKAGAVGRVAAATLRRRPLRVHTFHGHVLDGYFSAAFQRVIIEAERQLARRTDVLVAVSEQTRDSLLSLGIGTAGQYRVIPVGVDLTAHLASSGRTGALRGPLGIGDDVALVGALGRLAPIKDIPTLVRAVLRLDGAHLALIGDGPSRRELESLVDALGGGSRVHFVGWRTDVVEVLNDLVSRF